MSTDGEGSEEKGSSHDAVHLSSTQSESEAPASPGASETEHGVNETREEGSTVDGKTPTEGLSEWVTDEPRSATICYLEKHHIVSVFQVRTLNRHRCTHHS